MFRVNEIVRHTYQFIRLYFLHLYHKNLPFPKIERSWIKQIFSLISIRRLNKNLTPELVAFFNNHYIQTMVAIEDGTSLKEILDVESKTIITSIENHIKNTFYSYVKSLIRLCVRDKFNTKKETQKQFRLLKTYLCDKDKSLPGQDYIFLNTVTKYRDLIIKTKQTINKSPQSALNLLFTINKELEDNKQKTYAVLSLRKSLIPKYITLSSTVMTEIFKVKNKNDPLPTDIWSNIKSVINNNLSTKDNYSFSSLKTDMIGCSLCFQLVDKKWGQGKKKKNVLKELYVDDIEIKDEFKNKNIVVVDPNKGNLMYCYDGNNTLRYTQNQRRKDTKKVKYKKIRKSIEKKWEMKLLCEEKFLTMEESREKISLYSSKTTDYDIFKNYIVEKNKDRQRFYYLWRQKIYRKLNFNTKINTKKSESAFMKKFKGVFGSPENTIVIFGDWEQKQGISFGKEPTKGKGCRKMLREFGYTVYLKDEFRTSKICSKCHSNKETESNYMKRKDPRPWKRDCIQKVWALLRCKNGSCSKVFDRDMNSVLNMYFLSQRIIAGKDIPDIFKRKYTQSRATDTSSVGLATESNTAN